VIVIDLALQKQFAAAANVQRKANTIIRLLRGEIRIDSAPETHVEGA